MSESDAIPDVNVVAKWEDASSSSRTRPVHSGQYPSSASPCPVDSANSNRPKSGNKKNSSVSCKSPSPLNLITTSATHMDKVNYDSDQYGCAGTTSVDELQVPIPKMKTVTALPSKNNRYRKEAGIPVGIAVAWQRLVTSSSNSTTNTYSTTVACSDRSSPSLVKSSKVKSSNLLHSQLPKRPLSSASAPGSVPMKDFGEKSNNNASKAPDSKCRPASVNALPNNQGISTEACKSPAYTELKYATYAGRNRQYTDWTGGTNMSQLPHNYSATAAAYLQQQHNFAVQQQHAQQLQLMHGGTYETAHLSHNYLYHGYSPEAVKKYEQYLQQQSDYHRYHQEMQYHNQMQHQHNLQQEYDIHRATPVPSPRINIPSPSPTIHSHSMWPPELFHHNSSAILSPKSLASTPSPVAVQEGSNFILTPPPATSVSSPIHLTNPNKNCTSISPLSSTGSHSASSTGSHSASSTGSHSTSRMKDLKASVGPKKGRKNDKIDSPTLDIVKLEEEAREGRGTQNFEKKKHDFKRLESLIEKRDEISVPLLYSCTENNSPSSTTDTYFPRKETLLQEAKNVQRSEIKIIVDSCEVVVDGGNNQVPDNTDHSCFPSTEPKAEEISKKKKKPSKVSKILKSKIPSYNCSSNSNSEYKKVKSELVVPEDNNYSSLLKAVEYKCMYGDSVDRSSSSANINTSVDLSLKSSIYYEDVIKPPCEVNVLLKIKKEDKSVEPVVQEAFTNFLEKSKVVYESNNGLPDDIHAKQISNVSAPIEDIKPSFFPAVSIKTESQSVQNGINYVPVISKLQRNEEVNLYQELETNIESVSIANKCDNDITENCTSAISSSSSSISSVFVKDKDGIDFGLSETYTVPHQRDINKYQKHDDPQLIGNRNHHHVPLCSRRDDRFNFKSESSSTSDTIPTDHNYRLVQQFHHHNFLPIEEGNNHLDLLATVAQEFGNEIGRREKPLLHTLDTYEFQEVDEKIESFGQRHLLGAENLRSTSAPAFKPIQDFMSPPVSVTPAPIPLPSVVLKIPQITPMAGLKLNKSKSVKTEKTDRKKAVKVRVVSKENAGVRNVKKEKITSESVGALKDVSKKKTKTAKSKVNADSNICPFPVQEKVKAMKASKKQKGNIKDIVNDPDPNLKVMPLNLKKRRSTTDAIVIKKRSNKRFNSVSSCEYEIVQQPTKGRHSFTKSINFNSKSTSTNLMGGLERQSKKSKKQNQPLQKPNALSQDLRLQISKKQKSKLINPDFSLIPGKEARNFNSIEDSLVLGQSTNTSSITLMGPDKSNVEFTAADEKMNICGDNRPLLLFSCTSSNAENDWATNPTHAVTAIKDDSDSSSLFSISFPYSDVSQSNSPDRLDKDLQTSTQPSMLTPIESSNVEDNDNQSQSPTPKIKNGKPPKNKSVSKASMHFAASRVGNPDGYHIKPRLKAEPVIRQTAISPEEDDFIIMSEEEKQHLDTDHLDDIWGTDECFVKSAVSPTRDTLQNQEDDVIAEKHEETCEILTEPVTGNAAVEVEHKEDRISVDDQPQLSHEKVVIENVSEMLNDMRILTEIQGLFYTGKLDALEPPDVYGVTLDNERGVPPHLIFSAEEVLEKCIREVRPNSLDHGLRICAYWSPQYSGLYPGKISQDYISSGDAQNDLIPIEFDDGDTGVIKFNEIRLLASNHPIRAYDPNPLLTLEKKHRKRRHSSATGSQFGCTGDHEDADCGESYCAKIAKLEKKETSNENHSSRLMYWTWKGLGFKKPRSKKDRNKEFFEGIQRGDEIISVGDSALFLSNGNDRPFIGRVEKFWEKKGQKIVHVRWFYHPDEVKTNKRPQGLYAGALFESPHIDENDVQTIAKKSHVLPFEEFKEKVGCLTKWSKHTSQREVYFVAGFYDPYTYKLQLKDLK